MIVFFSCPPHLFVYWWDRRSRPPGSLWACFFGFCPSPGTAARAVFAMQLRFEVLPFPVVENATGKVNATLSHLHLRAQGRTSPKMRSPVDSAKFGVVLQHGWAKLVVCKGATIPTRLLTLGFRFGLLYPTRLPARWVIPALCLAAAHEGITQWAMESGNHVAQTLLGHFGLQDPQYDEENGIEKPLNVCHTLSHSILTFLAPPQDPGLATITCGANCQF